MSSDSQLALAKFEKTNKKLTLFRNAFYLFLTIALSVLLIMSYISNDKLEKQAGVITDQTDINQRFLRCLILVPQSPLRSIEERTKLVDKCILDSKTHPEILKNIE